MTTTFNRDQVLRLTRETLDHTLRFFNTVNENLLHVVENVRNAGTRPMNLDEVTRICTDFHRQHETRIHELTGIWTNFANTVKNEIPTTTPNLFDPNEVIRLNREMIDQTMRFFTTTNEALLKGQLPQHDQILPRNVIETITRAVSDFQKTQTELTRTFEQTFQKVLHTVTPTQHHTTKTTEQHHHHTTNNQQHAVRDEVFTLNREIIENTLRFFMNLNEHVVAIIENRDGKAIEQHTALINRIRDEFIANHQRMITRFDGFIKQTAETLSTAHLNNTTIPTVPQIFDHQELLKINQDAIASTVKYFTTVTENILQVRGNNGETLIQATQEYQKHHQILTSRLETIWRDTLTKAHEIVTHNLTQVHGQTQTTRHENTNVRPETREQTCCGGTHHTAHTTNHNTTHHTHETPNHTETPKATTRKTTKKNTSKH